MPQGLSQPWGPQARHRKRGVWVHAEGCWAWSHRSHVAFKPQARSQASCAPCLAQRCQSLGCVTGTGRRAYDHEQGAQPETQNSVPRAESPLAGRYPRPRRPQSQFSSLGLSGRPGRGPLAPASVPQAQAGWPGGKLMPLAQQCPSRIARKARGPQGAAQPPTRQSSTTCGGPGAWTHTLHRLGGQDACMQVGAKPGCHGRRFLARELPKRRGR